jgi:hypothetical protein
MFRFLRILFLSLTTLILVANNVVIQYMEKSSVSIFEDQDDDNETKKNDVDQKVKEFVPSINNSFIKPNSLQSKKLFFVSNNQQLPYISIDVDLLPPNLS